MRGSWRSGCQRCSTMRMPRNKPRDGGARPRPDNHDPQCLTRRPVFMSEALSSILSKHATAIDHVAIAVPELEQSIAFFTGVLGFELHERRKTEGEHTAMISAVLKAGPLTFVLLQGTSPQSQVSKFVEHYGPGVQHIAIAVEDLPAVA